MGVHFKMPSNIFLLEIFLHACGKFRTLGVVTLSLVSDSSIDSHSYFIPLKISSFVAFCEGRQMIKRINTHHPITRHKSNDK